MPTKYLENSTLLGLSVTQHCEVLFQSPCTRHLHASLSESTCRQSIHTFFVPLSFMHVHSVCVCRAVTRPVLILLPVLGLTWLCGVLVHLSIVVAYVFIALNAFQVNKDMVSNLISFFVFKSNVLSELTFSLIVKSHCSKRGSKLLFCKCYFGPKQAPQESHFTVITALTHMIPVLTHFSFS